MSTEHIRVSEEFGGYGDEDGMRKAFTAVSTLFFCSATEALERVTDDVRQLAGRDPVSVQQYLQSLN